MYPPLEALHLARLASSGRFAHACALELHRLLSNVALGVAGDPSLRAVLGDAHPLVARAAALLEK